MRSRTRFGLIGVSLGVAVTVALSVPVIALASPPNSTPKTVKSIGLEPGDATFNQVIPAGVQGEPLNAYWGRVTNVAHTGSWSLWCAGTRASDGLASTYWPRYAEYTRGLARLQMPEAADWYSGSIGLYYLMPSVGAGDAYSFRIRFSQPDAQGVVRMSPRYEYADPMAKVSAWTKVNYSFTSNGQVVFSRVPLVAEVSFFDLIEGAREGDPQGQGPAIDDITVGAYKFGPVRNPSVVWSSSPAGAQLSWSKPAASATSSSDDTRTVVYRIWRSVAGKDTWVDLTGAAGVTSTSYLDAGAHAGTAYDYVVQAWDPEAVSSRFWGVQSAPLRLVTPGSTQPVVLSRPSVKPSTILRNRPVTVTGKINPVHVSKSHIRVYAYHSSGYKFYVTASSVTTVGAPAGNSIFTAKLKLTKKGKWRFRSYHPARTGEKSAWSSYSSTVTVK